MNRKDTYGRYIQENGRLKLIGTDTEDERREYALREGTFAVAEDAFEGQPYLEKLIIPASLEEIPEGALSNGEGWASDHKGISEIEIEPRNGSFIMAGRCFCGILGNGRLLLLRVTGKDDHIDVPAEVAAIGRDAFKDCSVLSVRLMGPDVTVWFPKDHAFYLKKLLEGFGKNGKLYDFAEYDRFLCSDHFNVQRIKMIRGRLSGEYEITPETAARIKENMQLHEEEVLEAVSETGSEDTLQDLADAGFFTQENIDRCIERINRTDRKDLLGWLMDHKNRSFANTEFDFSI